MRQAKSVPIALSIAGSDSGGGAGIQADLKVFEAFRVHGVVAITCITAQNPRAVLRVQPVAVSTLEAQIEAVCDALPPGCVKTGMLFSKRLIDVVADALVSRLRGIPVVVDPVMVATSGARLLQAGAFRVLCDRVLPLASLVTPNLAEAEWLVGGAIRDEEGMSHAARLLHQRFGCAALVKGGHLAGNSLATDFLFDGRNEFLFSTPRIAGVATHGTGCAYSAAIAACLARGEALARAIGLAKDFIAGAIRYHRSAAGHPVLNSSWDQRLEARQNP
jgi:hydroxymethylpyrimidine kinase/phosphomethylpyrimidine kinase